jgi:hypothetical protein
MDGILSMRNPLNAVRRKVAPVLRGWEQERPNMIPGVLAGVLESAPIFEPTLGQAIGGTGKAILGQELYGAMQQMEADPTQRLDLMQGMLSSPLAYPMVAGMGVKPPSYGLQHRPMTVEGGASRLDDLVPAFGEDVYGPKALQYFGSGEPREQEALALLKSLRGKPDAEVTIYRGVPDGVSDIAPGDWVTLVPSVAADYGRVISKKVRASDITSWADSLLEFGYYPK